MRHIPMTSSLGKRLAPTSSASCEISPARSGGCEGRCPPRCPLVRVAADRTGTRVRCRGIEEHFVGVDFPVAELDRTDAVNLDRLILDGYAGVPMIQEPVQQGDAATMGPDPRRVAAQHGAEMCQHCIPAADAGRDGGIGVESVVGVEGDQYFGAVPRPCRNQRSAKVRAAALSRPSKGMEHSTKRTGIGQRPGADRSRCRATALLLDNPRTRRGSMCGLIPGISQSSPQVPPNKAPC